MEASPCDDGAERGHRAMLLHGDGRPTRTRRSPLYNRRLIAETISMWYLQPNAPELFCHQLQQREHMRVTSFRNYAPQRDQAEARCHVLLTAVLKHPQ